MWCLGWIKIYKGQGPVEGFLNMTMQPRNPGNEGISCLAWRLSASEEGFYFMI
jgi:hypothetical protein